MKEIKSYIKNNLFKKIYHKTQLKNIKLFLYHYYYYYYIIIKNIINVINNLKKKINMTITYFIYFSK